MEDVEDLYTYYVGIIGVNEDIFWNADYSFLLGVVENMTAFRGWKNYVETKERE